MPSVSPWKASTFRTNSARPCRSSKGEYVPAEHEQVGETRNAALSDELGVTDYLADRFAVVGTPEECRAKVAQIDDSGADVLQITAISHDPADIIRRFGEEVIAHRS